MGDYRNYHVDNKSFYSNQNRLGWVEKYIKKQPQTILEFGSYDGGDGVFYKKEYPKAKVYSIEACPERYKVIKQLVAPYDIEVFNYAVCDYDGFIDFYPVKDPNVRDHDELYGSSGSINKRTERYKTKFDHVKEQPPVKVPCIRLDSFCSQENITQIDYMHVDVEGAEHKVIEGLGTLRPSCMSLELHLGKDYYGEDAYDVNELKTHLKTLGYTECGRKSVDIHFVLSQLV